MPESENELSKIAREIEKLNLTNEKKAEREKKETEEKKKKTEESTNEKYKEYERALSGITPKPVETMMSGFESGKHPQIAALQAAIESIKMLVTAISSSERFLQQQTKPRESVSQYAVEAGMSGIELTREEIRAMAKREQAMGLMAARNLSQVDQEMGLLPGAGYQIRDWAVDQSLKTARNLKQYIDANWQIHDSTKTEGL